MKVLVYPHDLGIGGSQLNAIEIGQHVSRLGHEVMIYGQPGPLTTRVAQLGLEFIESPDPGRRPGADVISDLSQLIDDRGIDIVHGYEWPPGLECYLACRGKKVARPVTTIMSMAVAPFLPRTMELSVGTEQIAALERSRGHQHVSVIEPPVDTELNRPHASPDLDEFRSSLRLDDGLPLIVCVTRLARQLKLEGLLTAIDSIAALHHDLPARLLIVGDGEARLEIEERARQVNAALGYDAIVLAGEVSDPRAAYDLADVCIGMGGSALRSMAFAKPLIVQGEGGFFRLLTHSSLPDFLWTGWYGHGSQTGNPVEELRQILCGLLADPARRRALGTFGRAVIEDRFSLGQAAVRQVEIYQNALDRPHHPAREVASEVAAATRFAGYHISKRGSRLLGRRAADDFNARPVAKQGPARAEHSEADGITFYFAGVSWDAVPGTDRRLVTELSLSHPVVWVDPPMSWTARKRRGIDVAPLSLVAPGITRVNTSCPPGVSRPVLRHIARRLNERHARQAVGPLTSSIRAVVVSSPEQLMPRWAKNAVRIYYETDDFVAGAPLLGLDVDHATRQRAKNIARSDVVMGVTDNLTRDLTADQVLAVTMPNGVDVGHFKAVDCLAPAEDIDLVPPIAGVIGQLNDRLDIDVLEAVVDEGISLLLVGPRYEGPGGLRTRLDALIARPEVQWVNRQPYEKLPSYFAALDIGLTPYAATDFNRASYPLKTLEYLAAGLPVVSTDLPSARALDTELVALAGTPSEFVKATIYLLDQPLNPDAVERRRAFAAQHSWAARAHQLEAVIDSVRAESRPT